MWVKLEESLESGYKMHLRQKLHERSQQEHNKSVLTNHAAQENYMINWSKATVIDREPERLSRTIKEAIHIHREAWKAKTPRTETRTATNSVTPTTAFLAWHLHVFPLCQN